MNTLTFTQLTQNDVRAAVDAALTEFFSSYSIQPKENFDVDDIGKGAVYAAQITGKSVPTIYSLASKRLIPHSKRGGDLYFSKSELLDWLKSGKRRTQTEIAEDAAKISNKSNKQ